MDLEIKGLVRGYSEESKKLEDAVSTSTTIPTFGNSIDHGAELGIGYLNIYVDKNKFKRDYENDIYYNDNGAVSKAYDLSEVEDVKAATKQILAAKKEMHPEYKYVLKKGRFPLDIYGYEESERAIYSTHILYIKNFSEIIKNKEISQSPKKLVK